MRLGHSRREMPEINLTALIDVVFLLLIFFMVSTTFQRDSELAIELPEANSETPPTEERVIEITIDVQGRFYVDGRALVNTQVKSIMQALSAAAGEGKPPPIIVSADANTPHQAVVAVMDAARQLGFLRLSFATRLASEEGQ